MPEKLPPLPPPTPRTIRGRVTVYCGGCDRASPLLPETIVTLIARGYGNAPMLDLPLRCAACGSRRYTLSVAPEQIMWDGSARPPSFR